MDAGLRAGLALFDPDGSLSWYRSSNFGSPPRLKQGAHTILKNLPINSTVVIEGGGQLADIWQREAIRLKLNVLLVRAEQWRKALLLPRHQRTGSEAKRRADGLARLVIESSNAQRPTSLRHDAAEAILIGLWAVHELGLLDKLPEGFF